jgi:ABC-type lipoprotein release transport system permease subunit
VSDRLRLLLRLAVRNIRTQTRRSILTGLAMVVGLGLLVMSRSMAEGGHEDWIEKGVRMGSGHVTLQAPGFAARRTLDYRLARDDLEAVRMALGDSSVAPAVHGYAVRLELAGLAKLVEGRYLVAEDGLHAFVGQQLLERLDLDVGSRLVLTAQDAEGEIAAQLVRVAGVFRSGVPETDQGVVHIPLSTARGWLRVEGSATSVAILLANSRAVGPATRRLERVLADRADRVAVLDWKEAMPALHAAVRLDDFADWVFHAITLAIVALAIVNTILMSVLHRTREFGVTRALGMSRADTGTQVMLEGLVLTSVSGLIGIGVGLGLTWLLFRNGLDFTFLFEQELEMAGVVFDPVIYPRFHVSQILWSLGFVFVIGVLSSLYPAYRATRIEVAEAMKFE